jgi:hypothetical protein
VILYEDTRAHLRRTPPPWLMNGDQQAPDLCEREGLGVNLRWWGIGDPWLCGPQERSVWHTLDDGWRVCLVGGHPNPEILNRAQRWCDLSDAFDLAGNCWAAPIILSEDGTPIYRVRYGKDFLPAKTPEQSRAEKVAKAASEAIKSGAMAEIDMAIACQWAAELQSSVRHITPEVLGVLGFMDDALVLSTLAVATSLPLRRVG